jgi:hypothetical protein
MVQKKKNMSSRARLPEFESCLWSLLFLW